MSAFGRVSRRQAAATVPVAIGAGAIVAGSAAAAGLLTLAAACVVALQLLVARLADPEGDTHAASRVLKWTIMAFAGHLLLSILLNAVLYDSSDARIYHRDAVEIVRHWHGGFPTPALIDGKEGYYYLLAGLYWLFGPHTLAGLIVNAALAAALVPIVSDLTRRLVGRDAAAYVPVLVVLLPGLLLWTSQLLKEAAVVFLVAVSLNCATRLLTRISFSGLAMLAAALAVLFTMRSYVGLVVAVGIMAGIALGRRSVLGGLGAGLSAAAVMVMLVFATGVGYSGYKAATSADLKQADLVRKDLATSADSGFGSDIDISTPARALSHFPMAAATFLLGPFPWQFGSARELVALPDVLATWILLPTLWRGFRTTFQRVGRAVFILLLPAVMTTALLSLTVGNFGTVVRERSQVVIILVPFLAVGLAGRANRREPTRVTGPLVEANSPLLGPVRPVNV